MTLKQAIKEAELFKFKQVEKNSLNRMSPHVVVHGLTFNQLMVKIKYQDKSWI